jgi:hypothetical protein
VGKRRTKHRCRPPGPPPGFGQALSSPRTTGGRRHIGMDDLTGRDETAKAALQARHQMLLD